MWIWQFRLLRRGWATQNSYSLGLTQLISIVAQSLSKFSLGDPACAALGNVGDSLVFEIVNFNILADQDRL